MARSFLGGEFAGGESAWWRGDWIPNRDSGIKISEAWMAMVKKHNSQSVTKGIYGGITSASQNNNEDRNAPRTE